MITSARFSNPLFVAYHFGHGRSRIETGPGVGLQRGPATGNQLNRLIPMELIWFRCFGILGVVEGFYAIGIVFEFCRTVIRGSSPRSSEY